VTRDLLQSIFVLDPNLRIKVKEIKEHRYFSDINWERVRRKELEPVYKPNPLKFRYLL